LKTIKIHLLAAVVLYGAAMFQQVHAELAVIAHPDNALVGITKDELKNIYLGKVRAFPGGKTVKAVDQALNSKARKQFNRDVLQMSEGKRKTYWSRLMFTGKAKPPTIMDSDAAIKEWVATHPEALGYISGGGVDSRVKVLLIIP
jgi:ABC-type phosphate transport system substrate-binding protein